MLKHYLEQISALEFAERNAEISRLVTQEKDAMNTRGILVSTITIQAIADFFASEFLVRSDFLKTFIISHSNLLDRGKDKDVITEAKTLFQDSAFSEQDNMKSLYSSSVESIANALSNEGIPPTFLNPTFLNARTLLYICSGDVIIKRADSSILLIISLI